MYADTNIDLLLLFGAECTQVGHCVGMKLSKNERANSMTHQFRLPHKCDGLVVVSKANTLALLNGQCSLLVTYFFFGEKTDFILV